MTDHVADRLEEIASGLVNITPSGCETLARELVEMAAEMRKPKDVKPAPIVLQENPVAAGGLPHPAPRA
jgi:hypothetical protein